MSHQRPQGGLPSWQPPTSPGATVLPASTYAAPAPPSGHNVYAAPPDVVPNRATHGRARRRIRPWMVWTGAGALLLAAFASALAVIPDAAPIVSQELTKQRVLASGYSTFTGPKGHTPTAGAPWGSACVPVLFSLPPGASPELQAALTQVVDEARNGGLNVVALRGGTYDQSSLLRPAPGGGGPTIVPLKLDSGTPPISPSGRPTKVNMGWSMALAPDGRTEYLTKIRPVLFLKALGGDPALERKALRSVLAWSQGISGSTSRGTGIARHSIDSADTFTAQDLEAMRVMSGC